MNYRIPAIGILALLAATAFTPTASAIDVCPPPGQDDIVTVCIKTTIYQDDVTIYVYNSNADGEDFCVSWLTICVTIPYVDEIITTDTQAVTLVSIDETTVNPHARENVNKLCQVLTRQDCLNAQQQSFATADADGDGIMDLFVLVRPDANIAVPLA